MLHQGLHCLLRQKQSQEEEIQFLSWELLPVTPRYIQGTIPCLLYSTRRKKSLVKRLTQSRQSVPKVIKLFSYSTQLSTKFILLINVKMPIVGILTFISMINTTPERLKARNFFVCRYFILKGS